MYGVSACGRYLVSTARNKYRRVARGSRAGGGEAAREGASLVARVGAVTLGSELDAGAHLARYV